MGYTLFWCEHLAFWLLAFALMIAWISRIQRRLGKWLLIAGTILATLALLISPSGLLAFANLSGAISTPLVWPYLTVVVLVLLGGGLLLMLGRRPTLDGARAAQQWPLGILAGAVVAVFLLHGSTLWNLDLSIRQQMDVLRSEAGALAAAAAPPTTSEHDNAATLYQFAFESGLLDKKPAAYEDWWNTLAKDPEQFDAKDAEFVAYIRKSAPLVRLLREAANRPLCSFPRDWRRPSLAMILPETQNLRAAARELTLEAHYRATQGDLRGAFEDVRAIWQISDQIGQEPLLVSQLVSHAIQRMGVETLQFLLSQRAATEDDLSVFADWRPTMRGTRLQLALRSEEAFGVATFCQIGEGRELELIEPMLSVRGAGSTLWVLYRVLVFSDDLRSYRLMMATAQRAAYSTYPNRRDALDQVQGSLKATPVGILARLVLPALQQANQATARADAHGRNAYVALALQRYRARHGQFPESLTQLAEVDGVLIPRDPYDGEPIRYQRTEEEAVVYCVGPDGVDDKGTPIDREERFGDISFRMSVKK